MYLFLVHASAQRPSTPEKYILKYYNIFYKTNTNFYQKTLPQQTINVKRGGGGYLFPEKKSSQKTQPMIEGMN